MTDRFKFRVWDKPLEKYMEFKEFRFMNVEFTFNPITKEAEIEYDKERYIVEQSTGLKDKNGKLIYEGDILGGVFECLYIAWCDECKQFCLKDPFGECMSCLGDIHWCDLVEDDGKIEIIGNIHENKEYLK